MAIIKILQYPNPKLKRQGIPVVKFDERIKQIIADMFETHYNADNCAALAATQLDIDNAPMITVIDFSPDKNQPLCLVNPEIIEREGEAAEPEGCMSVAVVSVYETVNRAAKIRVKALNQNGEPFEMVAEGYMAKCIQHEIDHLNGKVFLDRLSPLKRKRIDSRIQKERKRLHNDSKN